MAERLLAGGSSKKAGDGAGFGMEYAQLCCRYGKGNGMAVFSSEGYVLPVIGEEKSAPRCCGDGLTGGKIIPGWAAFEIKMPVPDSRLLRYGLLSCS